MWYLTTTLIRAPLTARIAIRGGSKSIRTINTSQRIWQLSSSKNGPGLSETLLIRGSKSEGKTVTPLGWFLLVVPLSTFGLGCWQVKRKTWKEQLIKELDEQTKMPAVPLPQDLSEIATMEYRTVTARGKFLHDKEMLMGPRSFISTENNMRAGAMFSVRDRGNGYLVVTPFKLSGRDDIILVNRGWVSRQQKNPESRSAGQLDKEIELTGIVRSEEKHPKFSPDHKGDLFFYRDMTKMCASSGAVPVFLDASYESSIPGGPIGGQTLITLRNDHLSYLITWFCLSGATTILWYRQIVKRLPF